METSEERMNAREWTKVNGETEKLLNIQKIIEHKDAEPNMSESKPTENCTALYIDINELIMRTEKHTD
jgi:hypothetical protein